MPRKTLQAAIAFFIPVSLLAAAPKDYQHAPGPSAVQSRQAWAQATKRDNLALGKKVLFADPPNYRLTDDGHDAIDLTDGKLSTRDDDRIWFAKDAVGWSDHAGLLAERGTNLLIDLGAIQPVGKVVARFLGGREQNSLALPARITIVASDDGKTFYEATSFQKVQEADKDWAQAHPDHYFYVPETGRSFTQTLIIPVHRRARYIGLNIKSGGPLGAMDFIFSDEIVVLKDPKPEQSTSLAGLKTIQFIMGGVTVRPRQSELAITTNVATTNYFSVIDRRPVSDRKKAARVVFDLPPGVTIAKSAGAAHHDESPGGGKNRWIIDDFYNPKDGGTLPSPGGVITFRSVLFTLERGAHLPANATATFSVADDPDSACNAVTVPMRAVEIPSVGDISGLDATLAWMNETHPGHFLPDFYQAFHKFGFNVMGVFPRYFTTPQRRAEMAEHVQKLRQNGYKIIQTAAAYAPLKRLYHDKPEIYNQINGKAGKNVCPCYVGEYYRKAIQFVADDAKLVHPDFVFHDMEMWLYSQAEEKQCSRCQEAFAKSGMKDWDQFMLSQGMRTMRDLHNAIAGTAPHGRDPTVGSYDVEANSPIYHHIFDFNALYSKYIQLAQPCLYVQGDPKHVHDEIRANYDKLHSRQIIPWLTAGTYGECPPLRTEQMLLESYLNGARGVTWFQYADFDPMDFYYHAHAMKLLAPYQKLLNEGKQIAIAGDNSRLTYSAFGTNHEALILIGNYGDGLNKEADTHARLNFSGKTVSSSQELTSGRTLTPADLESLDVNPGTQRLLVVTFDSK
jgi:hypothetical protein